MNDINVQHATERLKQAQKELISEVKLAYPIGCEVTVLMGRGALRIRVTGHGECYFANAGYIYGVNVKTGKRREFIDRWVIDNHGMQGESNGD